MKFVIVTGLSGAGKSMAVNALEDIGFFCIDNIPSALLPSITASFFTMNMVCSMISRSPRSSSTLSDAIAPSR